MLAHLEQEDAVSSTTDMFRQSTIDQLRDLKQVSASSKNTKSRAPK